MDPSHLSPLQAGRKRYQHQRTQARLQLEKRLFTSSFKQIGRLTRRELNLVGIALYWAEGFKHKDESSLGFCTADHLMAKTYIAWLSQCLNVRPEQLSLRISINYSHIDRLEAITSFWSNTLCLPPLQFTKPFYQKTNWKKSYPDRNTYHGVIRIRVKKSINLLRQMRGWLAGLATVG